nr:hypothetical protein [Tanacetum cinerariifolium]
MVDFITASPLRIDNTDEGTYILATVDGIQRTMSESSLRRNLKLRDEDGIVSIPDTELFENLTLMGIVPLFDTMLVHQGEGSGTPTEPHHTPFPKANTSHPTISSIPLPSIPTALISPVTQTLTTPIRQYSRRARIARSSALATVADEPASLVRDVSEGEACPTDSGFRADQDRATIAKTSTLPHDLAPRVTSPATDEGGMQHTISKLMALCTSLQREGVAATHSGDDATIKGRSTNEGKATAERISNDSEDVARVLTFMDAATVLAGGIDVPTGSGSIPTAGPPATIISTGSELVPLLVARDLEEQQEKEDMRMNEQISRDAEVARIHAEEELQGMIDSLDKSNETIAKKNLGWRLKDFKGMTFEEIEAKFAEVWKQFEDFIPMGSKEETERLKRKGLNLEQEQVKKQKSSEEALEIETSIEEFTEEKMNEMMQLVPVEDVYVQALQVKHPIIDCKVHTEGQRSYWQIIRLGGSSACYQFFVDLLKQLDREDLNQL